MPRSTTIQTFMVLAFSLFGAFGAGNAVAQSVSPNGPVKPATAQVPSPLSLELRPAYDVPLGETANAFASGEALDLVLNYRIPGSLLTLSGGLEYSFSPLLATASLSLAAATAGAGIMLPISNGIAARVYGMGGYYYATYNDFSKNGNGPFIGGGLGLRFNLAPAFALNIGGQYKGYLGLYNGASIAAGIDIALGNPGGSVDMPSVAQHP